MDFGEVNPDLIDAVKGFEGYAPRPQWDYQQYSSGWGTKARPGEVVDQATHEQRLKDELEKAATFVDTKVPGLPQGVRDAMISLTFNAGGGWANAGLGEKLREGDYNTAQQLFRQYNKAGGRPLQGLADRRNTEASWFNNNEDPAASGSPAGPPVQAGELGTIGQQPYGNTRMADTPQQPPGLLQSLFGGGQPPGVGGLLGAIDPEKMAYLGMIAKGLDPYSSIDPNAMLRNAQAQQQHQQDLALRQRRQLFEEGQAAVANDLRERQLAQQNVTPAAKAAADFGLTAESGQGPGTQAYKNFMTSFYQLKGEGYTPVTIEENGEKRTVFQDKQGNFKTPQQVGIDLPQAGGNPYAASGKMTTDEGKSALFADRAATAHAAITKAENINAGLSGTIGGLMQQNLPAGVTNALTSGERGQSVDAQRAFINSLLRRESGAAISPSEFDSYGKEYFPQVGDSATQIEAKRKHRAEVIAGLAREGGRAYRPNYSFDESGNITLGRPGYTGQPGQQQQGGMGQQQQGGPPMEGARQAKDGNWYVKRGNQYFRVDQ